MSEIRLPEFPKNWDPFLAFTAGIAVGAFAAEAMARSDTGVVVIGVIAVAAMVVALIARLKGKL
jgi:hypothetical protein